MSRTRSRVLVYFQWNISNVVLAVQGVSEVVLRQVRERTLRNLQRSTRSGELIRELRIKGKFTVNSYQWVKNSPIRLPEDLVSTTSFGSHMKRLRTICAASLSRGNHQRASGCLAR